MLELNLNKFIDETRYPLASVKSFLQNGKRNLKLCVEKNGHETD